jgi:hypothetical protein
MYSLTQALDVIEADRHRVLEGLRGAAQRIGASRWVVAPTLPGARNGGDVLVHLRFGAERERDSAAQELAALVADPAVTRVQGVSYAGSPVCTSDQAGTVYRALLLRVWPDTPEDAVARFEHELTLMPRYVSTIRAWQLSRVSNAVGATSWTHVFEQEFSDVDGLMGPYLMHPVHWAVVDRWFDPETTDVIVRDRVCHTFCEMADPVLS